MYSDFTVPYKSWKDSYVDYTQMQNFDYWLTIISEISKYIPKKKQQDYICVISHISDVLVNDGLLIKGIFSLRLPFNSNDLVSLIKRTDVLNDILMADLDSDDRFKESDNIFTLIKLYSAFLDFRMLNPSEKNSYDYEKIKKVLPREIRNSNKIFFAFSQIIILGLILSTLILSYVYIPNIIVNLIITLMAISAIVFDLFYLVPKYYVNRLDRALNRRSFSRVNMKITDIIWVKSHISGIKRIPIIEFTTPNNYTDERFYLLTFSSNPTKTSDRFVPVTFLYSYNLIVDAPFSLEYFPRKNS